MNASTFRLVREVRRHLLAIADELARWRDEQPGVLSHQHVNEPTAKQSPRSFAGNGGDRGDSDGSTRR